MASHTLSAEQCARIYSNLTDNYMSYRHAQKMGESKRLLTTLYTLKENYRIAFMLGLIGATFFAVEADVEAAYAHVVSTYYPETGMPSLFSTKSDDFRTRMTERLVRTSLNESNPELGVEIILLVRA